MNSSRLGGQAGVIGDELMGRRGDAVAGAARALLVELAGYGIVARLSGCVERWEVRLGRGLVVWCERAVGAGGAGGGDVLWFRWWTGRLSRRTGRRVFTLCAGDAVVVAARRIADRYRELAGGDSLSEVRGSGGLGAESVRDGWGVGHGYSLVDLHEVSRSAARGSRWRALDYGEKFDLAFSAISEFLCESVAAPTRWELIKRGEQAIWEFVVSDSAYRGFSIDHRERGHGGFMPRFYAYWETQTTPTGPPERRVVERLALQQIWPCLTERNRVVIQALADHESYHAAAAALGVSHKSFVTMIYKARQQFYRFWHEGETPAGMWGRCKPAPAAQDRGQYRQAHRALRRRKLRALGRNVVGGDSQV